MAGVTRRTTNRGSGSRLHDHLIVRGAREHNLRDVSVELPRDSLVVFTGLSGSGKSSLAFDTIFAEGQRRYVESLSAYARQFLGQMDKPDVDFIEGLSPAVSIDQKSTNRNPRSTVGTITEVYDYLRLLFARAGRPHCPVCMEPITKQSPQQIVDRLLELPEGTRFQVLAPVVRARKGEYVDLFGELQSKGYARARVDGVVINLTDPPKLEKQIKHTIDVVIDRLVAKSGDSEAGRSAKRRLTDSVETALGLAGGLLVVEFVDLPADDPARERRFSERMACPNDHPLSMDEVEPRSFSFNSPFGACPTCTGIGVELEVDPELIVPDEDLSLAEGAIAPWAGGHLYLNFVEEEIDTSVAFDAAVFDVTRIAFRRKFFELVGVFGKQEKVALVEIGEARSFESFRDQVIEQQFKRRYVKDLIVLLQTIGVELVDEKRGDKPVQLVELVLRRNLHVHNRGIVDNRYLEADPKTGKPKYMLFDLKPGQTAVIDDAYFQTALRLCGECVDRLVRWASV